jgi:hypothetical protein
MIDRELGVRNQRVREKNFTPFRGNSGAGRFF